MPPPAFDYPGLPDSTGRTWFDFCAMAVAVCACLWPPEGEETWSAELEGVWLADAPGLFACFTRLPKFDIRDFAGFSTSDAEHLFAGRGTLQQVKERGRYLDGVATALIDGWDGTAYSLIEEARWQAPRVVDLLVTTVPGYHDRAETAEGTLAFDKLAFLCTAMMASRSERPLQGLDDFPVYPDYMLPLVLRHHGVLVYDPALARTVDSRREIEPGSNWELAIRWATVFAAEALRAAFRELGRDVPAANLDYVLWHDAVLGPDAGTMGEHHRTVTMAY
jgi:putative queuosine salvage protein